MHNTFYLSTSQYKASALRGNGGFGSYYFVLCFIQTNSDYSRQKKAHIMEVQLNGGSIDDKVIKLIIYRLHCNPLCSLVRVVQLQNYKGRSN